VNIDINVKVTKKNPTAPGEIAKVRIAIGGTIHQALLVRNVIGQTNLELDTISKYFSDKVHHWDSIGIALLSGIHMAALAIYNEEVYRV